MSGKPNIVLLTMGGTISTLPDRDVVKLKSSGLLSIATGIDQIAEVEGRDVLAKPSASLMLDDLAVLAEAVNKAVSEADGVIITHGTDTLEEMAFALSLLIHTDKPIVFTGALRRSETPGMDGPANMISACRVAASPASKGKGVMIVMNDEIHSALFAQKSHSFLPSAFTSLGPLGWIAEDRVRFFLAPAWQPPGLSIGAQRPTVPLLETGIVFEKKIISAVQDFDGLVLNATGVGHVSDGIVDDLEKMAAKRPVIFASRAGHGETFRATYTAKGAESELIKRGLIPAGFLSGRQARVALILLLSSGASLQDVRDYFLKIEAA